MKAGPHLTVARHDDDWKCTVVRLVMGADNLTVARHDDDWKSVLDCGQMCDGLCMSHSQFMQAVRFLIPEPFVPSAASKK